MLETPLYGRFVGEDRRLIFDAPAIYRYLVRACAIGGGLSLIYGLAADAGIVEVAAFYPQWWSMVGVMVGGASVLAALSLQSISFDLRERKYRRRQGPGFLPRGSAGLVDDLDAIVLLAEPNNRMIQGGVTYHLVLHWKGAREPIMVLQQDTRTLHTGQPLQSAAQPILAQGMRYAKALRLPFYDNSHFASPCPVSIWR
jgi:hypothetical protein